MRTSQKGFTLVELIVVITILAILGTIAFISLQGYSQDARDAKVTSDVTSISRQIETRLTESGNTSIFDLQGATAADNVVATAGGFGNEFAFNTASGHLYEVAEVNYTALALDDTEFRDSNNNPYLLGAVTMTAPSGPNNALENHRFFQVVGQAGGADTRTAVVRGSYYSAGTAAAGLVSEDGSGNTTGVTNGQSLPNGLY